MAAGTGITGFVEGTIGEAAAFAAGLALHPVLEPIVQALRNTTWAEYPDRPIDAATLAEAVAVGHIPAATGRNEAKLTGISQARFDRLTTFQRHGPDLAQALVLWRRAETPEWQGAAGKARFEKAMQRAGLEPDWFADIEQLKAVRLTPQQVALGIVRSVMADPGLLPVDLDTSGGTVPAYTVSPINTLAEAAAGGIDRERLRIMVGEIGLPMSVQQAASALFRGIIEHGDYNRAVLEGDTRPEWADAILEQARQIASASDYVNARIRGWITDAEMYAGTARHGMSQADTHLLYLIHGRPAAPGQMATAAVRGIDGPDGRPMDRDQFLKGIAESDIRPEWGPMLWESRFLYLPAFQLTRLVQSGAITPEVGKEWAIKERYAPEVCDALYKAWTSPSSGTAKTLTVADWQALAESGHKSQPEALAGIEALGYSPADSQAKLDTIQARRVDSELSKAMTDLRKAYLKDNLPPDITRIALADLGTAAWAVDEIMRIWDAQKNFSFSVP